MHVNINEYQKRYIRYYVRKNLHYISGGLDNGVYSFMKLQKV